MNTQQQDIIKALEENILETPPVSRGNDDDKEQLFAQAYQAATKRVVVKSPNHAESLAGKPSESFSGKLLRYDVYLKG
jgi:galactose-1-phosphate uridylyltransferase